MTDIAIRVENLGKRYQLGSHKSGSFRESLSTLFKRKTENGDRRPETGDWRPETGKNSPSSVLPSPSSVQDFWALQDINFEIKRGEAVGIIGRNGAGKSTLLKILSRITEPTRGRFEIFGRVSSLLEIGTGFHPELTGRENVYLNGTILGMKRREVKAKFDEIVAFSGVEKFIDTPVKHYSSGMQVRLAFAVAAHLEPEILIIDEVLAVGDAEFQKKCLGKMEDVTGEGRTVLFVSHNMGAVKRLCGRGVLLVSGSIDNTGEINEVVDSYLKSADSGVGTNELVWYKKEERPHCDEIEIQAVRTTNEVGDTQSSFLTSQSITIELDYEVNQPIRGYRIVVQIVDSQDNVLFASTNHTENQASDQGAYKVVCTIPPSLFNAGLYRVKIHFGIPGAKVLIPPETYLEFSTILVGNHGSTYHEKWPGIIAPKLDWKVLKETSVPI